MSASKNYKGKLNILHVYIGKNKKTIKSKKPNRITKNNFTPMRETHRIFFTPTHVFLLNRQHQTSNFQKFNLNCFL